MLYIKLQMVPFVFYRLLLLLSLFAEIALYLFGGDSKHLRWEGSLRFYSRTNLGGKPRLSYINYFAITFCFALKKNTF